MPLLSIVSSLYWSQPWVAEFCRRAGAAASAVSEDYEIVLVDDGSPDESVATVRKLMAEEPRIRLIRLSRNFGHHRALAAGLAHARGDYVFMIDCDLEEDPALLVEFWQAMLHDPMLDVVYGVQEGRRKGGLLERVSGQLFYAAFAWLTEAPYVANQLTARLMKRNYVEKVLEYPEREFDLWGLFVLAGFRQKALRAVKGSKGQTTYTLSRKLAIAFEMISSFSTRPLLAIFLLGLGSTLVAFLLVAYLAIFRWLVNQPVPGWTSIVVSIWLVGGLVLISLGIIGLYLSKIFLEVKQRPRYHVASIEEHGDQR